MGSTDSTHVENSFPENLFMVKVISTGHHGAGVMEKQDWKHHGRDPPGKVGKVSSLIQ